MSPPKEKAMKTEKTAHRPTVRIVIVAACILMVPLVAMQFTEEVVWSPFDFAVAGALLVGTALAYEFVAKKAGNTAYRIAAGVGIAAALLLVWINLAVGIIGTENNPANLMYGGVLAVGGIGALIARFQPHGMARALFATALAQALVALIALIAGEGRDSMSVAQILGVNGMFIALFTGSALLFRHAAREHIPAGAEPVG